jgi:hypothetical protein
MYTKHTIGCWLKGEQLNGEQFPAGQLSVFAKKRKYWPSNVSASGHHCHQAIAVLQVVPDYYMLIGSRGGKANRIYYNQVAWVIAKATSSPRARPRPGKAGDAIDVAARYFLYKLYEAAEGQPGKWRALYGMGESAGTFSRAVGSLSM